MSVRFAIVVAAGQGRRMGFKKQFFDLCGRPMWLRSIDAMFNSGAVHVVVVTNRDDIDMMQSILREKDMSASCTVVAGGSTRHESVVSGVEHIFAHLGALYAEAESVLIAVHDAARPFVFSGDVERVYQLAEERGAAILGTFCRDTIKWVEDEKVVRTLPRQQIFLAQTPQVIRGDFAETMYLKANLDGETGDGVSQEFTPTDDSSLLEVMGVQVACVESSRYNGKLTTPDDLEYAEWLAHKLWKQGVIQ